MLSISLFNILHIIVRYDVIILIVEIVRFLKQVLWTLKLKETSCPLDYALNKRRHWLFWLTGWRNSVILCFEKLYFLKQLLNCASILVSPGVSLVMQNLHVTIQICNFPQQFLYIITDWFILITDWFALNSFIVLLLLVLMLMLLSLHFLFSIGLYCFISSFITHNPQLIQLLPQHYHLLFELIPDVNFLLVLKFPFNELLLKGFKILLDLLLLLDLFITKRIML